MQDNYGIAVSSDPAADGSEHAITLSATDGDKIITALAFSLVTDANAANRYVGLTFEDASARIFARVGASAVQVASKTYFYSALPASYSSPALYGIVEVKISLPLEGIYVPAGGVIRTDTEAIQATDNFGVLTYQFRRPN